MCALAVSGLPTGRFTFEGFLSANKKERREALTRLAAEERTMVFHEAPHKLRPTLADMLELLGDHEKILTLIRQEDIPTDISDAVLNRYKEVEHLCEHSEENRKIQDGLTLGNGQTTAKYWDFVRDYLDRQKKKL